MFDHYKFECVCLPCVDDWPNLISLKAGFATDPEDKTMTRFHKMICSQCQGTIRRKLPQNHSTANQVMNPEAPITCLVCGHETQIQTEVRQCISDIKSHSKKAVELLVKGKWRDGIESVRECDRLMNQHFALPLLDRLDFETILIDSL